MLSISVDKIKARLTLGMLSVHTGSLSLDMKAADCESSGAALDKYLEALNRITEMLTAYQELLEHDIEQIRDSVDVFETEEIYLKNVWIK